jgi:hypothetical protein
MNNASLQAVDRATRSILGPLGFKKQKRRWCKSLDEMMRVIYFEKYTFSNAYYLRYGLSLMKFINNARTPCKPFDLHVQWEEEGLPSGFNARFRRALDFTAPLSDQERIAIVEVALRTHILPAFDATDTIDKLREVLRDKVPPSPYHTPFTKFLIDDL